MITMDQHMDRHEQTCGSIVKLMGHSTEDQLFIASAFSDEPDEMHFAKFPFDFVNINAHEESEDAVVDFDAWQKIVDNAIPDDRAPEFTGLGLIAETVLTADGGSPYEALVLVVASTSVAVDIAIEAVEVKKSKRGYSSEGMWFIPKSDPEIILSLMERLRSYVVFQG